jgi:hypothetical protein
MSVHSATLDTTQNKQKNVHSMGSRIPFSSSLSLGEPLGLTPEIQIASGALLAPGICQETEKER